MSSRRHRARFLVAAALALVAPLCLPACERAAAPPAPAPAVVLFDGTSLAGWSHAGPGGFDLLDGALRTRGGMGLLWFSGRAFSDVELELDWRTSHRTDNSGVFVRFPAPGDDPWVAVRRGYEIQINDDPTRDPQTTGAIYGVQPPITSASRPAGEWNHYRIRVVGAEYAVWLNQTLVARFVSTDPARGRRGYVGLQNHDPNSTVDFRAVRAVPLP
ncbi:MAG TPA: DUF1080 domain-containing protein [Mycobacteriales bacterium]|nr:DUF1080 domain-containing protein [Mycobacteriales bacterium]